MIAKCGEHYFAVEKVERSTEDPRWVTFTISVRATDSQDEESPS